MTTRDDLLQRAIEAVSVFRSLRFLTWDELYTYREPTQGEPHDLRDAGIAATAAVTEAASADIQHDEIAQPAGVPNELVIVMIKDLGLRIRALRREKDTAEHHSDMFKRHFRDAAVSSVVKYAGLHGVRAGSAPGEDAHRNATAESLGISRELLDRWVQEADATGFRPISSSGIEF